MPISDILSKAAKLTVVATLRDPMVAKIDFLLGPWAVAPRLFNDVAAAVAAGNVEVVYNSAVAGKAYYYHETDQIELGFMTTSEATKRALIIHECVHAGFDLKWHSAMDIATSEAAGYLAQCIFARAYSTAPDDPDYRLYNDDPDKDAVFIVGWRLAGKVLASEKLTNDDHRALSEAVLKHPDYEHGRDIAAWDGVKGYWYRTRR